MSLNRLIALGTLITFFMLYALAGMTNIDPGEVGLKIKKLGTNRGMEKSTLDTGIHWIEPLSYDVATYDTRKRQYKISDLPSQTKDGQPILVDVSLEIGLIDEHVPYLHEKVGHDFYDQVVYPALRAAVRNNTSKQNSDNIYTGKGRALVQASIELILRDHLTPYGIDLAVNLRAIEFVNKTFVQALERKANEAQNVIIKERQAQAAVNEAFRVKNIAEGNKQKRIKAAEAEKAEIRLRGEGQKLAKEAEAKGNLAIYRAEAEGTRLQVKAYGGGATYASVKWAENLAPKLKVYGFPTGAPGTSSIMDLNGMMKNAFGGKLK